MDGEERRGYLDPREAAAWVECGVILRACCRAAIEALNHCMVSTGNYRVGHFRILDSNGPHIARIDTLGIVLTHSRQGR